MQATAPEEQTRMLLDFLGERGRKFHYEEVTQLEHALQCAALAEEANAGHTLITSALLHDIGHLLVDEEDDQEEVTGRDFCHEEMGADSLAMFFPAAVTDPIRLHVPAKRYLCTVNSDYWDSLSEASRQSLAVQGGKMS
ncbi:MAG: HD domain-containing protein, partial [Verrucomicrobiales bacterium]